MGPDVIDSQEKRNRAERGGGRAAGRCVRWQFFFLFAFALQRLVLIKLVSLMKIGDWGNLV